jgi:hypothetical protein
MADLKISELASANVVNKDDLFYLIQDNDSYNVKASTLFSSITDPTLAGNILLGGTVQTLNAAGTVSITTTRTDLYGGRSADANAISNGSILPSTIFLYTEDVSATGRGFTFANGTPTTQTLYVRYKNDKIHLSQADSTVFTYPPEDWVGPTGLRPFPTGLQFVKGSQYIFNVSDPSNTGNVLALSSSIDGTNTLGTRYTANVVYNGTPGTAGANVVFTVANVDIDPGGKFYLDLPQGADGQLKIINLVTTLGGQFVLASNIQNNLAIELKRSGDSAFLMYSSNGWILVGSNPGLTTTFSGTSDDISEGSKLYFTNARARAAITAIDNTITYYKANGGIAANIQAITENIVAVAFSGNTNIINEGSENLYYTNNRVLSNVSQMSINVLADVDTTGITSNGTLIWNGTSFVAGIANEAYSAVVSNVSQTSNIANVVLTIDTFSTSNLREGSNLYYTNARVYANVIPLLDLKANVVDLTTANVAELNNLYYTNARVISALVGQDIVTNNVIIQGDLTVEGNVVTFNTATLTVEDKNIVLANGAINSSAADGSGFNIDGAQANLKYRSTGDKFEFNKSLDVQGTLTANGWANLYAANVIGLTTANVAELTNLYYTNARVYSNVTPLLDLKANVVDLTTANVAELTNLYYTNARVYANVTERLQYLDTNIIPLISSVYDLGSDAYRFRDLWLSGATIRLGNTLLSETAGGGLSVKSASGNVNIVSDIISSNTWLGIYTANVLETEGNLYYTNARVYANVIPLLDLKANVVDLTTSNIAELTNLYYTNDRVYSNVIPLLDLKANVVDLTTANVAEGTNLYFTNARVLSNVSQMSINVLADVDVTGITANGTLIWNGTSFVAGIANEAYSAVTSNVSQTSNIANVVLTIDTFTTSNLREGSNLYFTNTRVIDALTTANVTTGNLVVSGTLTARSNVGLTLGTATQGNLISNAITMTVDTTVTNGIAQLNEILGKLVPAAPIAFPGNGYIAINSVSTFRMANFAQTDNTPSSRNVGGANIVSLVRRASSYTTTTMNDMGPGNTGTVTLYKNGSATGARTLVTGSDNGTYGDLVISDNVDYATKTGAAGGFWESFDTNASGTVSAGWNEVYINHSQGGSSNIAYWYYDSSSPGAVVFSVPVIYPTSNVYSNSSTIPHYTSATVFTMTANVKNLSGDMFPTSNTFITGSSATGFGTPSSLNYESAGVTGVPLPLTRNLYVSSGNAQISTTVNIASGFGTTTVGPSLTGQNSYISGTGSFSLGATVLYKTATISSESTMEESNIWVQGNVGSGAGYGARIINPGSTDTPVQSASALLFNSNTSTLLSYDATIVGATLKHDQTNYSVGYLPVGPNLSSGRGGAQYYTFKFSRASVGKFNIKFTGQLAGLWVALPGSAIDTTAAATNGWVDMSVAYPGSGVPSYGCALGGTVTLNTAGTQSKTCTFGSANSSDSGASGEIYIRIRLNAGQTITALAILGASN